MTDEATVAARYDTLARLSVALGENERLSSENARLRELLRPIAEVFADWSAGRYYWRSAPNSKEWMYRTSVTCGHMRECCSALGIEVPK